MLYAYICFLIMNDYYLKKIEQLQHTEMLLGNCISYLWEIWNNEDVETIKKSFENLGFTKEDMDYWEIEEDLHNIEEDSKRPWENY